jgi:hypothetical protein
VNAGQINAPICPTDFGLVVINSKSALDHDALSNASSADLDAAMDALGGQLEGLMNSAAASRPQAKWDDLFTGKARRPILFLGQSLFRLPTRRVRKHPPP